MHSILIFLAGFVAALILVSVFGKKIDAKAKAEADRAKALEAKLRAKL